MAEEKAKTNLGFKYERKRIKREKQLSPLCSDYEPKSETNDNCKSSALCKNATYFWKDQAMGVCYGGTKASEVEDRKKKLPAHA